MSVIYAMLKGVWKLLLIAFAMQTFYWGVMFAGAWLGMNDAPHVPYDYMALAFLGYTGIAIKMAFPPYEGRKN